MHSTSELDPEALFLRNQRNRVETISNKSGKTSSSRKRRELHSAAFRQELTEWKNELAQKLYKKVESLTEEDKRKLKEEFWHLKDILETIRKKYLSTTTESYTAEEEEALVDDFSIPLSDLKYFHDEISSCQIQLQQRMKEALPKGKFIFRRYRQAMKEQDGNSPKKVSETGNIDRTERLDLEGRLHETAAHPYELCRFSDCVLAVKDSVVDIENKNGDGSQREQQKRHISPYVFRRLSSCILNIQPQEQLVKTLHFVDLKDCVIRIAPRSDTAVQCNGSAFHVTNCHHCEFHISQHPVQQIRIHQSMHVDFYLDRIVTGGVILESSQEITFHVVEDQKTSPMDVRDFHWLRPGIPSPNYRILQFMPSNRESSMNSSSSAPEHHDNVSSAPIIRTGEAVPAMSPFLDSSLPSSRELLNSGENDEEDEL